MNSTAERSPTYPCAAEPASSAFFLVGPTAVGKTAVAHALALADGLDILSADSMLVYRGMDVGTAKPTLEERGEVSYWGLDLVDPHETFSAGAYLDASREAFRVAAREGRPLIVAGGTGLYVRALTQGLDAGGPAPGELRERLDELHRREGVEGLQARLRQLAPDRLAALRDPVNPRRLMRALELAKMDAATHPAVPASRPPLVGLMMPRDALAQRIQSRVEAMYRQGLPAEAERIRSRGAALSATAMEAIGYREVFDLLDGTVTEQEAKERTMVRTRQLAKRQMTWFRNQEEVTWIEVAPGEGVGELAARVRDAWERIGPATELAPGKTREVHDGGNV